MKGGFTQVEWRAHFYIQGVGGGSGGAQCGGAHYMGGESTKSAKLGYIRGHSSHAPTTLGNLGMYSYVIRISLVCTRMSFVCQSYVLVCHPYVTCMYSYVIHMTLVCTRRSSICHSYVPICHLYVIRMYSYVISMSLVCTHMSLVCHLWFYHEHLLKWINGH